jgi:hypothetical protein
MSNDLQTADGFDVPERGGGNLIVGKLMKFNNGAYVIDKTETLPPHTTLVVLDITTAWVKWRDGKPVEHRITYPGQVHPDRDDLPDQDEALWEEGLTSEPADPWKDTRYVRMVDPRTGADYTFVTDSYGGRRAVGELKSQVSNVRYACPGAVPIVELGTTQMKTNYGPKPRPSFRVVGWKGKGGENVSARQITDRHDRRMPSEPNVAPSYDDEIPF